MKLLPLSFLCVLAVNAARPTKRHYDTHNYYVVEHDPSTLHGSSLADVASALGVEIVEQAGELINHWLLRAQKPIPSPHHLDSRGEETDHDPVIEEFDRLKLLLRTPYDSHYIDRRSTEFVTARGVTTSVKYLARQSLRQRVKRAPPPTRPDDETPTPAQLVAERLDIHDPLFTQQWHLVNNEYPEHMMNVTPVWEMGITGKGVIASMVDDGLDYESEDLKANFDAANSHDFNDHEDLPTPKLFDDHHGTRCAGQIAAGKNSYCGMGIAYESKVAGVRILSGPITDVDEAAALNYGFQNVSVYSCSWGPPDNGQSMEGPEYLITKAVVNGINNGRAGKGSIFVFASGNGAANGDQCNFDGYTNSIYSVTVAAVDFKGLRPYYSEACAANLVVAYSSGSGHHIVTTDTGKDQCATTHGGTSAAAPNAAGVIALALEVRPELTWRDVQHLCVVTGRQVNLAEGEWEPTAAGRPYSYIFGYGALDAYAFVQAAKDWQLVKPQGWFETKAIQLENGVRTVTGEMTGGQLIPPDGITSTLEVTQQMLDDNNFETLEHIRVRVWISHHRRGDVEVDITSPNGIKSMLAEKRSRDSDTSGYPGWTFMSVKHWGENPVGTWTIRVADQAEEDQEGYFLGWNMMFWGSVVDADRAIKYELPLVDDVFPPIEGPHDTAPISSILVPSATKTYIKPTAHLTDTPTASSITSPGQGSEDITEGDANAPQASSTPTPDEGWFSDMSSLVSSQKWFFGAIGAVVLFGIAAGAYFWRRHMRLKRQHYASLQGDELAMSSRGGRLSAGGGPRTKELYDAFGEVSDEEDEDADESTKLRGSHAGDRLRDGIGFHSGFLDDDEDPVSASLHPATTSYRDEPEVPPVHSPPGEGGSDGSWEHANAETR